MSNIIISARIVPDLPELRPLKVCVAFHQVLVAFLWELDASYRSRRH